MTTIVADPPVLSVTAPPLPPRTATLISPARQYESPHRRWTSRESRRFAASMGESTLAPETTYHSAPGVKNSASRTLYRSMNDSRLVDGKDPSECANYECVIDTTINKHVESFLDGLGVDTKLLTPCGLLPQGYASKKWVVNGWVEVWHETAKAFGECAHPCHQAVTTHERDDERLLDSASVFHGWAASYYATHELPSHHVRPAKLVKVEQPFLAEEERFAADLAEIRARRIGDEPDAADTQDIEPLYWDVLRARRAGSEAPDALRYWTGPTAGGVPILGVPRPSPTPRFVSLPTGEIVDLDRLTGDRTTLKQGRAARACDAINRALAPIFRGGVDIG